MFSPLSHQQNSARKGKPNHHACFHYHTLMTFEITNLESGKVSHCGVLEFSAEDGFVYIPDWMMHNLLLLDGQSVKIEKTGKLAKATYMKIQPHSTDFVKNLSDPKVVLEEILKDFACITVGDTIMVKYKDQSYYIDIIWADPEDVVSLFDTDCEVDILQPLDQIKTKEGATEQQELQAGFAKFKPFNGVGQKNEVNKFQPFKGKSTHYFRLIMCFCVCDNFLISKLSVCTFNFLQ